MDYFVGSFWTKRDAVADVEARHLGRGRRRRLSPGIYEVMPLTDSERQPTYYIGEYNDMHDAGWGETISRNHEVGGVT